MRVHSQKFVPVWSLTAETLFVCKIVKTCVKVLQISYLCTYSRGKQFLGVFVTDGCLYTDLLLL